MATISTSGIASGSVIEPAHILRPIEALNGETGPFDITISGSLNASGSFRIATSSIVHVSNHAVVLAYDTASGDVRHTSHTSGTSGT